MGQASRDGRSIITDANDGVIERWDAVTGHVAARFPHWRFVTISRLSPDGSRLLTYELGGALQQWDLVTGAHLGPTLNPAQKLTMAEYSPDSRRFLTTSRDGTVRLWPLTAIEERPLEDMVLLAQLLGAQRLEARCGAVPLSREELGSAWHELRSRYPAELGQPPSGTH
jgi:hypothetical protein